MIVYKNRVKNMFLNKTIIYIFILVAVIIIFIFLYLPLLKDLDSLSIRYKQESKKLENIKQQIATSDNLKAKAITRQEEITQALDELTRKANSLDFKFDSLKQSEMAALGSDFMLMPISIESTCDFQAIGNFLGSLEDLEKSVVVVQKIKIETLKEALPNLKLSLELAMYVSNE